MSLKKIFKEFTPEEIVDSLVITEKLTPRQREKADKELAEHRERHRAAMTEEEKLRIELRRFKFELKEYITQPDFDPKYSFGYFLERYLQLSNRKKKDFAGDIQIHETLLSNLLKDRREPNESIMVRLELHSNNAIPATDWFLLNEKSRMHHLRTDKTLRDEEGRFVTRTLQTA